MRFFRFVIILLSESFRNHYHIYHHLAFLFQPIRPHRPSVESVTGHEIGQQDRCNACEVGTPPTA